jgi:hypothetical protein
MSTKRFGIFDWAGNRPFGNNTYETAAAAWEVIYGYARTKLGKYAYTYRIDALVGEYVVEEIEEA